ncbi:hypothetical protein BV22DRAFT_1028861 [Leucogyrophana mollusca]|uniref:Uncharacterized protein n=2 Tax=Leucogyrophana mollusca TaxID=85980 RepID=A0ACB8B1T1_9AGAM|nr:hypothetical protein BV22DRAFT_1041503 [Leucogyrophana mollusca]KAH7929910.1 hypothetical protein BV22DRAFT_1028861 [Leucogyrophana mollusca]
MIVPSNRMLSDLFCNTKNFYVTRIYEVSIGGSVILAEELVTFGWASTIKSEFNDSSSTLVDSARFKKKLTLPCCLQGGYNGFIVEIYPVRHFGSLLVPCHSNDRLICHGEADR